MISIKQYIEYLKDNPKQYWFKAKLYGWGWTPATWQGWSVIGVYLLALLFLGLTIDETAPLRDVMFSFFLPLLVCTGLLLWVCWRKGERPRWQWGIKK